MKLPSYFIEKSHFLKIPMKLSSVFIENADF